MKYSMRNKLKICFVCNEYPPYVNGGIGTFTKEISEELVKLGHAVYVIGYYDNLLENEVTNVNGVAVYRLKKIMSSELLSRIKLFKSVKELVDTMSIDIVECQENIGLTAFWPKLNAKKVIRLHGSVVYFSHEFNRPKNIKYFLRKVLEKNVLNTADKVISVSNYTALKTKKYFGLNIDIETIYNGVKPTELRKTNFDLDSTFNVVYAGTLSQLKGVLVLYEAWNIFVKKYPNSKLHLVGRDLNILEHIIISDDIIVHGMKKKSELLEFYKIYDVAIFPSFAECFSLAPLEAMSVGIPVINTMLTSGCELVIDNKNGILVDPNKVESLVCALEKIYKMSSLERMTISDNATCILENKFNFSSLVNSNLSMYKELLGPENG